MKVLKKIKIGYSKFWGMEKYFDTNLMEKEVVNKIDETVYFCLKMVYILKIQNS